MDFSSKYVLSLLPEDGSCNSLKIANKCLIFYFNINYVLVDFDSRHTCKVVLKMYHKLYLPSRMTSYRSQHTTARIGSQNWNVAAEMQGNTIANNRSYIPRFCQTKLRASVLGRKLEILDVSFPLIFTSDLMTPDRVSVIVWCFKFSRVIKHAKPSEIQKC